MASPTFGQCATCVSLHGSPTLSSEFQVGSWAHIVVTGILASPYRKWGGAQLGALGCLGAHGTGWEGKTENS